MENQTLKKVQELKLPDLTMLQSMAILKKVKDVLFDVGTTPDTFFQSQNNPKHDFAKLFIDNNIEFSSEVINSMDLNDPQKISEFLLNSGIPVNDIKEFLNKMVNKLTADQLMLKVVSLILDDIIIDIENNSIRYGFIGEQIMLILSNISQIDISEVKLFDPDSLMELMKKILIKVQEVKILAVFFPKMNTTKPQTTTESNTTEPT